MWAVVTRDARKANRKHELVSNPKYRATRDVSHTGTRSVDDDRRHGDSGTNTDYGLEDSEGREEHWSGLVGGGSTVLSSLVGRTGNDGTS